MQSAAPFAEVMRSTLHTFHAECWSWDAPPAFGQLVCVTDAPGQIFGIVTHIMTGPRETHRAPMPLQKTHEELRQEYPHIFQLLHTTFTCVVLGYYQHETFVYQAPPTPARLHAFIQEASHGQHTDILCQETYLPLLFHAPDLDASIDELVLAIMRHMGHCGILTPQRIAAIIDTFSMLINNDYRRLKVLLQRIERLRRAYQL